MNITCNQAVTGWIAELLFVVCMQAWLPSDLMAYSKKEWSKIRPYQRLELIRPARWGRIGRPGRWWADAAGSQGIEGATAGARSEARCWKERALGREGRASPKVMSAARQAGQEPTREHKLRTGALVGRRRTSPPGWRQRRCQGRSGQGARRRKKEQAAGAGNKSRRAGVQTNWRRREVERRGKFGEEQSGISQI
jgi:hypothetical protein